MADRDAFTGRKRRKETGWTVRLGDAVAGRLITIGGIGTIVAVSLVFLFLMAVVAPLFSNAELTESESREAGWFDSDVVHFAVDEYQVMGWSLSADGWLRVFRVATGKVLDERRLIDGPMITAVSSTIGATDIGLGFEDGSVRFGTIGFETSYKELADVEEDLKSLSPGETRVTGTSVVELTPTGLFRFQQLVTSLRDPVSVFDEPVRVLDHLAPESGNAPLGGGDHRFITVRGDGQLLYCELEEQRNQFSGAVTLSVKSEEVSFPLRSEPPFRAMMTGRGDNAYLVWRDGRLLRFDTRTPANMRLLDTVDLLEGSDTRLNVCQFLLGRESLVCGDSRGRIRVWFRTRHDRQIRGDGFEVSLVHELPPATSAVTTAGSSSRSRLLAAGYEDGSLRVFHVTTKQQLLETRVGEAALHNVAISPKEDVLLASTGGRLWRGSFDPAHPEATVESLFQPVWYEGYSSPEHIWQSTSATQAPEPKFGMWPLVFGTLKATFYSMLFGAPLALLAAIYTSEFMQPRWRARIKPTIETMASLPSVVLGFLAALVIAPFVEDIIPSVLAAFVTVPLVYVAGAFLWQLIPQSKALALSRFRFLYLLALLPVGVAAAVALGPLVEQLLFAAQFKRWTDGQVGTGLGAWLMLFLPLSAVAVAIICILYVNTWIRRRAESWSRTKFAVINGTKFVLAVAATLALAYGLSLLFTVFADPRGTYVDTYEQRNALIVGFVMGFAIIPIIYTIADDALSTVPNHLRSASLGCGATPWQTAIRIVVPTAMSGLFSALMIGLGRAVGETMIVLMAGGNTPVTEWNMFNGFRTLSANIAVEMPEAPPNSTHYRTLFLAALTLFMLTFFVNTLAELVRLRFRRRAHQL